MFAYIYIYIHIVDWLENKLQDCLSCQQYKYTDSCLSFWNVIIDLPQERNKEDWNQKKWILISQNLQKYLPGSKDIIINQLTVTQGHMTHHMDVVKNQPEGDLIREK